MITSVNPASGATTQTDIRRNTTQEIKAAIADAASAHREISFTPGMYQKLAILINDVAADLESKRSEIVAVAQQETNLPAAEGARLHGELTRTVNQLRMFADVIEKGEAGQVNVAAANAMFPSIEGHRIGVGPVTVIPASNFPLAFSVAGGDTASAWAAGCPVIVRGCSRHPLTSKLVADIIESNITRLELPKGVFRLVWPDGQEASDLLITDAGVKGLGFTGSRKVGDNIIKQITAAGKLGMLLHTSLEMGSANPTFVFPAILAKQAVAVAEKIFASVTNCSGQFCTKEGFIIAPAESAGLGEFLHTLKEKTRTLPAQGMLDKRMADDFAAQTAALEKIEGVSVLGCSEAALPEQGAHAQARIFCAEWDKVKSEDREKLLGEIFGPTSVVIIARPEQYSEIAGTIGSNLVIGIHRAEEDKEAATALRQSIELNGLAGRIVHNGALTGVAVNATNFHGGEYPAAFLTHTAVGRNAWQRFSRPYAVQGPELTA